VRIIRGVTNINKHDDAKDYNFLVTLRLTYSFKHKKPK